MANETNFFLKKVLIWKETTKGVTPSPVTTAYSLTALSLSLAETQKTETSPTLGNNGQSAKTDFGSSDFAGNVELKYTGGVMPIICDRVIGTATKTDASTSTWTATTVTVAGNIVNSVAGTASLVCKTGGTTGSTEPVHTGKVDGDLITDGTVVWVYRSAKLKKYVGSLNPCLGTVGIEIQTQTGCETTPVTFNERYTGVFINGFEIAKSNGTVVYKYTFPAVAVGRTDSTKTDYTALTVTTEKDIVDNSFGFNDCVVTVGGSEPVGANNFRISVNRNTSLEDGIKKGERIDNTPIVTIDGELKLKFTKEQYASLYDNPTKAVVVTLSKENGDKGIFTFPYTETLRSPLEYATDKPIYLTAKLNAYGTASTAAVSYEVISTTGW